uniref:Arf-GAP with coiled-coil, ANK repeat and PH domain-containing protein n=1 Tax=Sinocyclocheilus grahami TaxID=75366 RepID=A0A672SPU3_SINGR
DVVEIEAKLDKLVKLCSGVIEAGRAYISANKLFINGIRDLSHHCKKEEMISECLEKCGESLQEIVNYHMILFDQAQRSVKQQLHNFVKEDVRKFKETKKQFDKVREDMEIAQVKNAQAPRNKPHEVEEASSTLITTRKCFRHLALDYVLQINVLQAKKKFEILDSMLSFMQAQYSLFQQGFNILDEVDPYMKKLAAEVRYTHICFSRISSSLTPFVSSCAYSCLWTKFIPKNMRKRLNILQRYFETNPTHRSKQEHKLLILQRLDRTASPSTSSIDSASEPRERIVKGESILQRVQSLPGNEICCDCGQADPRWASINLGILLCIECSGIHRSLGVHCSKVRSLTLDTWEPELMKLMCELGNTVINQIYEGACEEQGLKKPGPNSSRSVYVLHWYVYLLCVCPLLHLPCFIAEREDSDESSGEVDIEQEASDPEDGRELDPKTLLHKASRARNLSVMAEALAHGADVNSVSEEDESKSPLIQAVAGGSLIACEFLLQNGADVNQRDVRGRAPLHHATCLGHTGQVCLFLKRGASQMEVDEDGQDPLSIAVQAANPDIVTLLRLARMNEEMREADGPFGQPGITTCTVIFREFPHMALHASKTLTSCPA